MQLGRVKLQLDVAYLEADGFPDPRVLEMALHSVDAQAYPDWELCIVDDACAQPSIIELLQAYAAHRPGRACLRRLRSSMHIAGATNAALELARGEYVAFLDHDDELTPDALLEVVAALQDDPLLVQLDR